MDWNIQAQQRGVRNWRKARLEEFSKMRRQVSKMQS